MHLHANPEPSLLNHVRDVMYIFHTRFSKANLQLQSILASFEYGKLKNNKCHSELNYAKAALSQLWNGSLAHKRRQNESFHSPTLPEPRNGPYQTSISHTCWSAAKADITSASVNPRCVKDASLFFDDLLFCTGLITAWTNASKSGTTRGCNGVVQQQTCLYTQSCKQKNHKNNNNDKFRW